MTRFFYSKLAVENIRKNAQTYLPYMLTSAAAVTMYYIMHALSQNVGLGKMVGGTSIRMMLDFGTIIVGFFSVIFLLYTNSFLIKRRKKEFGLFNVLGLEKKHIARIMTYETMYIGVISIAVGLVGGVVLSKLMFLLLLRLLRFDVQMGFEISGSSMVMALTLFGGIFFLTLLGNLRQIHLAKPIELLKGGQVGEREPKTKWLMTLFGLVTLGSGYYLALTTESPIAALTMFFIAVMLVIVGTYLLFTSGSITLLKLMRKNKRYYYKANHFTTVSGLMYRMKRNAVGLANICILSSMVLVTLSTTVSLYVGVEDVLKTRYPKDITISSHRVTDEYIAQLRTHVSGVLEKHGLEQTNVMDCRMLAFVASQQGSDFITDRSVVNGLPGRLRTLLFIPGEDYSRITGKSLTLAENEVLMYSEGADFPSDTLTVLERTFTVKEKLSQFAGASNLAAITGNHYVIVKDMGVVEAIYEAQAEVYGEYGSQLAHYWGFDLPVSGDELVRVYRDLRANIPEGDASVVVETAETVREAFYSLYGGMFFLGLFLGALFIMGTVLIIYYKQITEGYEDKQRFEIMQKVGMSNEEVKKSIQTQVLTVFFLPMIASAVHIAVAFPFMTKLLGIFSLTNTALFAWCTVGTLLIFTLFYAVVYTITARMYYKIVRR